MHKQSANDKVVCAKRCSGRERRRRMMEMDV